MNPPILETRHGSIALLKLNRPEQMNLLTTAEMIEAIEDKLTGLNADPEVRAVVLTGAGRAFSAGGDVKYLASDEGPHSWKADAVRRWYQDGIQRIPRAMHALDIPSIAAVNGFAIGAGLDLACMCDVRIAAQSARFAASFVKIGLLPGDGGVFFLSRVVGYPTAGEMLFTGKTLSAEEALARGLVSLVVPDADLMESARSLAQEIASNSGEILRLTKRLLRASEGAPLDTILELSASLQSIAHATEAHHTASKAMAEKLS